MSGRERTMGGMAHLDGQGGLSDTSITQYCHSPTVHIWKGRRDQGRVGRKGGYEADLKSRWMGSKSTEI
jgi:hypothetical protein